MFKNILNKLSANSTDKPKPKLVEKPNENLSVSSMSSMFEIKTLSPEEVLQEKSKSWRGFIEDWRSLGVINNLGERKKSAVIFEPIEEKEDAVNYSTTEEWFMESNGKITATPAFDLKKLNIDSLHFLSDRYTLLFSNQHRYFLDFSSAILVFDEFSKSVVKILLSQCNNKTSFLKLSNTKFIIGCSDGRIECWDVLLNEPIAKMVAEKKEEIISLFSLYDENNFISCSKTQVLMWDIRKLQCTITYNLDGPFDNALSKSVIKLANDLILNFSCDYRGSTFELHHIKDKESSKRIIVPKCNSGYSKLIELRDGRVLLFNNNTIQVWDIQNEICLRNVNLDNETILHWVEMYDGSLLTVTSSNYIKIWHTTSWSCFFEMQIKNKKSESKPASPRAISIVHQRKNGQFSLYFPKEKCVSICDLGLRKRLKMEPRNFDFILQRATNNDPIAQMQMGKYYLKEGKIEEAFDWFVLCADGGNSDALSERNKLIQQQPKLKLSLLIFNAKQKKPQSYYELAHYYFENKSHKALGWFQQAVSDPDQILKDGSVEYEMGQCYEQSIGTAQDMVKAFDWYSQSAQKSNPSATQALNRKQLYIAYLKEKVESDADPKYCAMLGHIYLEQEDVRAGPLIQRAYLALDQVCKVTSALEFDLGICFEKGIGLPQSYMKANECYERSSSIPAAAERLSNAEFQFSLLKERAEAGLLDAIKALGLHYFNQNNPAAFGLLYEAYHASKTNELGYALACCYEKGLGVTKDYEVAAVLFQELAIEDYKASRVKATRLFKEHIFTSSACSLKKLNLEYTNIGNNDLLELREFLMRHVKITEVNLKNTKVTEKRAEEFRDNFQRSTALKIFLKKDVLIAYQNANNNTHQKIENNKPSPPKIPSTTLSVQASFKISYNELVFDEKKDEIGAGSFGRVYKGTCRSSTVAIKKLFGSEFSERTLKEFKKEIKIMVSVRCDDIVAIRGYCIEPPNYCIIMEHMEKGSLHRYLGSYEEIASATRYKITKQMANGLSILHANKILHRDLKSPNVLLDAQYNAKLSDFGLSKVKTESSQSSESFHGTLRWAAPEVLEGSGGTEASDIFSLGIVIWEVYSREIPFAKEKDGVFVHWVRNGQREKIPDDCPDKIAHLIRWCWNQDPKQRPTAQEVVLYLEKELVSSVEQNLSNVSQQLYLRSN